MSPVDRTWAVTWVYPEGSQRRVAQIVLDEPDDEPAARHEFLRRHPYANIKSCSPVGRVAIT